jgi:hypothetical protein
VNKRLKGLITALFLLLPLHVAAADDEGLTGIWSSSFKTPRGPMEMSFELEVLSDNTVRGFIVNPIAKGKMPLSEGSTDGNNVQFKVEQVGPFGPMIMVFDGHVDGNTLYLVSTYEGTNAPEVSEVYNATRKVTLD